MNTPATRRDVMFWGCMACSVGAEEQITAALFLGLALLGFFTGRK